jgi:hypothetical protein
MIGYHLEPQGLVTLASRASRTSSTTMNALSFVDTLVLLIRKLYKTLSIFNPSMSMIQKRLVHSKMNMKSSPLKRNHNHQVVILLLMMVMEKISQKTLLLKNKLTMKRKTTKGVIRESTNW